ncbi:MAG: AAA family ATPase, partial [Flavobacteriaceae bacterium]|nr:AAA family ATPase [Flavobacteriaceae bacterium]
MKYWHIQMNQPWGRNSGKIDSSIMLKEPDPIIGTGDWVDIQCDYFTGKNSNGLKIGDIIFVHEGNKPIAICKIKSDSFQDPQIKSKFHHDYYRYVDAINWYTSKEKFPQPQGTLERLINKTSTWIFIDAFYKNSKKIIEMEKYIEILSSKKQIILQGPPGTGKTRLAKKIAQNMIGSGRNIKSKPTQITKNEIKQFLKPGQVIPSVKDKSLYTILSISGNNVKLQLTNMSEYSPSFAEIIKWYYNQKWNKGEQKGGTDPYSAAVAKYIYESIPEIIDNINNYDSDQFKLIQFHPSYTYEDFVRGIVSVPNENGEGVLFKTENKILADFAEKALKNKLDSQKGATELSKEKWLNEQFEKFIYFISEELEKNENIELTDSVFLVELNEDAFRYKGLKGWSKKGNRMLFKDIKQAYLDENFERQDLIHNQNLSGLAKWHASYYVRVLDLFKSFLEENKIDFIATTTEKEELKNYVLIIDEINRANLPSVLGELIYALEYRDEPVESMYAIDKKNELILPSNLFIIGTMNTADRSVGHIDYAIKRRFAFVDILPTDQA